MPHVQNTQINDVKFSKKKINEKNIDISARRKEKRERKQWKIFKHFEIEAKEGKQPW